MKILLPSGCCCCFKYTPCTLQQPDAVTQNGLVLEGKKSGGRWCCTSKSSSVWWGAGLVILCFFLIYFVIWFSENLTIINGPDLTKGWEPLHYGGASSATYHTWPQRWKRHEPMNPLQSVQHCLTIELQSLAKDFCRLSNVIKQLKIWFLLTSTAWLLPMLQWCTNVLQGVSVLYDRRAHLNNPPPPKIHFKNKKTKNKSQNDCWVKVIVCHNESFMAILHQALTLSWWSEPWRVAEGAAATHSTYCCITFHSPGSCHLQ